MVRFTAQKLLVLTLLFGCFSLRAMEEGNDDQDLSQWISAEAGSGSEDDLAIIQVIKQARLKEIFKKKKEGSCEWVRWVAALGVGYMVYSYFVLENLSGEGGGDSGFC